MGGELESSINFEIFKIDSAIHREEISLYRENEDLSVNARPQGISIPSTILTNSNEFSFES